MQGIILPVNHHGRELFVSRVLWTPIRYLMEIGKTKSENVTNEQITEVIVTDVPKYYV